MKNAQEAAAIGPANRHADLSAHAAAIESAAEGEATTGTIDTALGTVADISESDISGRPGRKPGGKNKHKKKGRPRGASSPGADSSPTTAGTTDDVPDDFLKGAIGNALQAIVQASNAAGWQSPASPVMSEADWVAAVAECADVVIEKYIGPKAKALAPEIMLAGLVLPWLSINLWKVVNERRKSHRAVGRDGKRQDTNAPAADRQPAPGDTDRSHDG